jgi:hypothetical protein
MERWAAKTLRTLSIILTAGFVLIASFLLLLLSMCAANGGVGTGNKDFSRAVPFLVAAGAVLVLGIFFIAWLARGIQRSSQESHSPTPSDARSAPPTDIVSPALQPGAELSSAPSSVPLHLSPLGRKSIHRLVVALGAQIALSALALIFNRLHFWSGPRIFSPFPSHNWLLLALTPFVLYHIPYAMLIFALLKHPDRRAFTYSLAVPAVLIMQALLSLGYFALFATQHPVAMILLIVPWSIHIVILVLAYQAIQRVGLHPEPSSLIVAAVASLFFFFAVHVISTFLYRLPPNSLITSRVPYFSRPVREVGISYLSSFE